MAVPELLLKDLVRKIVILCESKADAEAARRAGRVVDLEARDGEFIERVGKKLTVRRLNVLIQLWWALLED